MTRTATSFDLDADVLARVKRLAAAAGLTQRAWLERAVLRAVTGITVADYLRARVAGKGDDAWKELTTEQQQMVAAYNAAVVPASAEPVRAMEDEREAYRQCAPLALAYVHAARTRLGRPPTREEVLATVPTADRRQAVGFILDAMGYHHGK